MQAYLPRLRYVQSPIKRKQLGIEKSRTQKYQKLPMWQTGRCRHGRSVELPLVRVLYSALCQSCGVMCKILTLVAIKRLDGAHKFACNSSRIWSEQFGRQELVYIRLGHTSSQTEHYLSCQYFPSISEIDDALEHGRSGPLLSRKQVTMLASRWHIQADQRTEGLH